MKKKKSADQLFQMSRRERNASIVLLFIIVFLVVFRFAIPKLFQTNDEIPTEVVERMKQIEQNQDSIFAARSEKRSERRTFNKATSKSQSYFRNSESKNDQKTKSENITHELFPFDPNVVTHDELLKLGFSEGVANVLLKYRERGGKFKTDADLKKIYGVDSLLFARLLPYISIEGNLESDFQQNRADEIVLEMNSADSAAWTTLKGIGPSYAGRICKYRKMLGGFTSEQQLLEIYNFPRETFDAIKGSLKIDLSTVTMFNINFADISELKSHPYCKYENAKKIVDYRSKHGSYKSVDQLLTDSVLTSDVFYKLSLYLSVE